MSVFPETTWKERGLSELELLKLGKVVGDALCKPGRHSSPTIANGDAYAYRNGDHIKCGVNDPKTGCCIWQGIASLK